MLPSLSIRVAGVWRHVTCGVTQNIATGGERVGLEKEFNIRKLAGSERGLYLLQFIYECVRLKG